jgi:hypothetical protein
MLPMLAARLDLGETWAADSVVFVPAAPTKLMLYQNDVAIDENLVLGDLTAADFDGYAAIASPNAAGQVAVDPVTGDQIVTVNEAAGGWRWETTGLTNLPQTIFGFALTNAAGAVLLAIEALPVPVTLTASGQEINIGTAKFTVVLQPMN